MRIDKFLKVSRIVKRRTLAKEVCEGGKVQVNGKVVKPGHEVRIGDRIDVALPKAAISVVVEKIAENVPAKDASSLYKEV